MKGANELRSDWDNQQVDLRCNLFHDYFAYFFGMIFCQPTAWNLSINWKK